MPTNTDGVWAALALSALSFVGLLVGAIAGLFTRMPHQPIAMAMSVGAGLLLAAVSLRVAVDAFRGAGPIAAALSLVLGAAVFSAINILERFGAAHRKRCGECIQQPAESQRPGSGVAVALGNALERPGGDGAGNRPAGSGRPPHAADRLLGRQRTRRSIEHRRHARGWPQLPLHLSALECGRHRRSGSNRGGVASGSPRSVRHGHRGCRHSALGPCWR